MDAYDLRESVQSRKKYPFTDFIDKPIIIYYFVDPFCHKCWSLEPYIKKLTMEYGEYFNIRPIISHMFRDMPAKLLDYKINKKIVSNNDHLTKYYGAIGIKAAALQGNKAGRDFLRSVQEAIFLYKKKETIHNILLYAAKHTHLDRHEFENDLFSLSAIKAYESDIQFMHEMNINQYPTLLFFSQYIEDYSMKVSGLQSYESYTFVLKKMLQMKSIETPKLSIKSCLKRYKRLNTDEIAFIFDMTKKEAEKKLKQLQLMQIVKRVEIDQNYFWEYCD